MLAPATAARTLAYVAFGEYAFATVAPSELACWAIWSACWRFQAVLLPIGPTISAIFIGVTAACVGVGAASGAATATASAAAAISRNAGTAFGSSLLSPRARTSRPCVLATPLEATLPFELADSHGLIVPNRSGPFPRRTVTVTKSRTGREWPARA